MRKREYRSPETVVIHLQTLSLLAGSPFEEAETEKAQGLGDPEDYDEDQPGL